MQLCRLIYPAPRRRPLVEHIPWISGVLCINLCNYFDNPNLAGIEFLIIFAPIYLN